jgi:hypothetical protein
MTSVVKVRAGEVLDRISIDVRIVGLKVARFRLWLAAQVMKLAGWVAGCEARVEQGRVFDELPPLPRYRSYMLVGGLEVPRQASVDARSPFYVSNAHEWATKMDFLLDGQVQERIVSYDIDAGYMRVHRLGPDGEPFVAGDEVATEVLHGNIEIRPRETC